MLMRILSLVALVAAVSALTVEVNNIHYGSRNIYQAASFTLSAAELILTHHRVTKDELTPDVIAFIKTTTDAVTIDFNQLRREFQPEDVDLQAPRLLFRSVQKPFVVVSIYSESAIPNESEFISLLVGVGQAPEEEEQL